MEMLIETFFGVLVAATLIVGAALLIGPGEGGPATPDGSRYPKDVPQSICDSTNTAGPC